MRFRIKKRVPFADTDPASFVFYPRYFVWFHDAFEAMFEEALGATYAEILARYEVGYPAVQTACEFRGPARYGDLVDIEVFLSRLGERSATFEYRVRHDGVLISTASVKIATMHMTAHHGVPMPEAVANSLKPYIESDDAEVPETARIR